MRATNWSIEQYPRGPLYGCVCQLKKGLERQRGFLAGDLERFCTSAKATPEVLFEEGCVMYVGLTRARSHLSIHPDSMDALRSSTEELKAGLTAESRAIQPMPA